MLDWVLNTPGLYNMVETLAQQNSIINPYSKNVSEKVGNQSLKLFNKHFPRHHKFYKLFNKKNVKVR